MESLKKRGMQTSIHYPPIHQFSYYLEPRIEMDLSVTETIGSREVTLPLYPSMTDEQVSLVLESVKESLEVVLAQGGVGAGEQG